MFGNRYTVERKRRAELKLEKKKQELQIANETLGIERETRLIDTQISLMEVADKKLTAAQTKLLKSTSQKAIAAQIQGMNDQVEKSLPALLESRQKAGQRMITASLPAIQSIKDRAKS